MSHKANSQGCPEMLDAFPFPVAVLDDGYHFVLLNRASVTDPLLARGRVGATDLDGCIDEPAILEQARARHMQYERSLRAQALVCFEEKCSTLRGQQSVQWVCIPVRIGTGTRLVVIGLGADAACTCRAGQATTQQLIHKINKELRAPLGALVGLVGTLAGELSGEQHARASLIDQSGQHILKQLSLLMDEAEKPCQP